MSLITQVICRQNKDYIKKNGRSALYLLVRVNDDWDKFALNLDWQAGKFDDATGSVLPRQKSDIDVNDYNLIIRTEVARVNEIFKRYRLSGQDLTIELLNTEYYEPNKAKDFLEYMSSKIKSRLKNKEISQGSHKVHFTVYRQLLKFRTKISYQDLTVKFVEQFQTFLRKQLAQNTCASYLRTLKSYITLAKNDFSLAIDNPFGKAKVDLSDSDTACEHLLKDELKLLFRYYDSLDEGTMNKVILSRFFVGCYTGLRISDITRIDEKMLESAKTQNQLVLFPQKTARYKKILYVNLHEKALFFIEEMFSNLKDYQAIQPKHRATVKVTEQVANRKLKEISEELELNKKLTYHVSRHTFATNYLRAGGRVEHLQDALGHSSISITMRYVHIVNAEKADAMNKLADFYNS
ncbi:site-specific integrase [Arcicella sp. LKC2W]|uniref:tyrosine-type recombinase/integrase n=1 Tax=Arcicella sp. LKC2W TaxID=2984198 RepID=UPI002B217CF9|nr:site-specific integrase [Arcicella sp. LKC2W]MEA5459092.1 site-specific integrase [Arcicella sp. LKC2W]